MCREIDSDNQPTCFSLVGQIPESVNGLAQQALTMTTLEQCKQVRTSVAPEVQSELFKLMTKDPDAAINRMVEIAGEKGLKVTSEEVRGFLRAMDDEEELMTSNWLPSPSPLLLVVVDYNIFPAKQLTTI